MSILCLTGWQQRNDELASVVPADAQHFDYASYDNVKVMFADLPANTKMAMGWSLGGQLLVRAVANGYIKPELLVLLSAPYQYVADEYFPHGVHENGLKEFRDNYDKNAPATLKQFNALVGLGDNSALRVIRALNDCSEIWSNGLFWLNELTSKYCYNMDFSQFPKTLIVQGKNDKVIDPVNAMMFAKKIPQSQLIMW